VLPTVFGLNLPAPHKRLSVCSALSERYCL
jgi:hypothetical protein